MRKVLEEFRYFSDKRFSTLAGTLAYFFLMSVTPFLFWLALIVGEVDLSAFTDNEIFAAVAPVLEYLQTSAQGATGGAGIILLVTSLWSSTNFFYHLRRSGEIIYDNKIKKGGLSLRFSSLLAVFASLILIAFAAALPFLGAGVLQNIMPKWVASVISVAFLMLAAFFIAYLLNVFACPYDIGFENTVPGVFLTVMLWLVFAVGFSVYLRFANPQRLYGAVAAVIVFLLWCYLMVNSLIIGVIYNRKTCMPERLSPQNKTARISGRNM
ncbi:MAG: YihY/virulence factor BrkB family protein [Roseburia sp.]|nr:YihY/virulence factor BrkB family protein [Roseburia sp.]